MAGDSPAMASEGPPRPPHRPRFRGKTRDTSMSRWDWLGVGVRLPGRNGGRRGAAEATHVAETTGGSRELTALSGGTLPLRQSQGIANHGEKSCKFNTDCTICPSCRSAHVGFRRAGIAGEPCRMTGIPTAHGRLGGVPYAHADRRNFVGTSSRSQEVRVAERISHKPAAQGPPFPGPGNRPCREPKASGTYRAAQNEATPCAGAAGDSGTTTDTIIPAPTSVRGNMIGEMVTWSRDPR